MSHHIAPVRHYVAAFVALLILTVLTVAVAQVNFGDWNIVVAMLVAITKASVVILIFMGLLWDRKIHLVLFLGSFIFIGIFFIFTLADISFRSEMDPAEGQRFGFKTPVKLVPAGSVKHH